MFISVAICTWNRSGLLRRTLEHFRALHIPSRADWELLVVDNNCTDDTSSVLASFADTLPLKALFEKEPGQSHARNRAVQAARGAYILWTDDDVLVSPDWLTEYVQAIERWPDAAYYGGPIDPWFAVKPPRWIDGNIDLLEGTFAIRDFGAECRPLRAGEMPFGANMAFASEVLRRLPFNGRLGRKGNSHVRGDETDVFRALQSAGQLGIWVGGARVQHYIPAERLTLRYIWNFFHGGGRTFVLQGDNPAWACWSGVPRWAVRQCLTAGTKTIVLAPFRSRSWLMALRDTAKSLGTMQEARCQYLLGKC